MSSTSPAATVDCSAIKYNLFDIKRQMNGVDKNDKSRLEDTFTFWAGRYIQSCKPDFNVQQYSGPRKRRMRNIG